MGYYISVLAKEKMYDLNGEKLVFIEKIGKLFYFYKCKYNAESFEHQITSEKVAYNKEHLNYLKRYQEKETESGLQRIGQDKVFPRY